MSTRNEEGKENVDFEKAFYEWVVLIVMILAPIWYFAGRNKAVWVAIGMLFFTGIGFAWYFVVQNLTNKLVAAAHVPACVAVYLWDASKGLPGPQADMESLIFALASAAVTFGVYAAVRLTG